MSGSEPAGGVRSAAPRDFSSMLALEPHGPDTFVGVSPPYSWRRIYGGQVIAQALWAAAATVPAARPVHSLHAYFILGGRLDEPVRYEVDRVRNGRSFMTRRVVARQSYGAILTLEASFHVDEPGPDVETVWPRNAVPGRTNSPSWAGGGCWRAVRRRPLRARAERRRGCADDSVGDDPVRRGLRAGFRSSDTGTVTAVRAIHPKGDGDGWQVDTFMGASLDHAVWSHRPARSDRWLLIDVKTESLTGVRVSSIGHARRPGSSRGHGGARSPPPGGAGAARSDGATDLSGT
jgi:acyl-CoA thioesterase-2